MNGCDNTKENEITVYLIDGSQGSLQFSEDGRFVSYVGCDDGEDRLTLTEIDALFAAQGVPC